MKILQRIYRWWRPTRIVFLVVPEIPHYHFLCGLDGKEYQRLAFTLAGRWCPSTTDCDRYQQEMIEGIQRREKAAQKYRTLAEHLEKDIIFLQQHLFPGEQKK